MCKRNGNVTLLSLINCNICLYRKTERYIIKNIGKSINETLTDIKGSLFFQHSLDYYRIFESEFKLKEGSLVFLLVQ